MRREWRKHAHKDVPLRLPYRLLPLHRIEENHELADRGIEFQRRNILANFLKCLMQWRMQFRRIRFAHELGGTSDALEEAPDAHNAIGIPWVRGDFVVRAYKREV